MSNGSDKDYAFGRLVLDYVKAFIWPLVAVVIVVIYQDDVRKIISEREVDIFGLRIGEQIKSQTMVEIEDIRLLVEAQQESDSAGAPSSQVTEDLVAKLASLERNLSREIGWAQTGQQALQAVPPPTQQPAVGPRAPWTAGWRAPPMPNGAASRR